MKKNNINVNSILEKIKECDTITIKYFFDLMKEYDKYDVLTAFKCFFSSLTEEEMINKYFDFFLYFQIGPVFPDRITFNDLCLKYGKERISSYLSQIYNYSIDTKVSSFINDENINSNEGSNAENFDIYDGNNEFLRDIDIYLKEIGSIPTISDSETIKLFKNYHDGDKKAKKLIIESNLRLVVSIAKNYYNGIYGFNLLDIIQEGNIGLINAIDKFDINKGCMFSTYATYWIRQAIFNAISYSSRIIRIPTHLEEFISKMQKCERKLNIELGRMPTNEEIAYELGCSLDKVVEAKSVCYYTYIESLNVPINEDSDTCLIDYVMDKEDYGNPEYNIFKASIHEQVMELLSKLPDRTKKIIMYRYGLIDGKKHTLKETGRVYGITDARISKIEKDSFKKLKKFSSIVM